MSTKGARDYRPKFHYTPPKAWINDPNGLLYEDGTWHLFAQHYPDDTVWGPMHWIHATSKDLLNWEDQGIALYPDAKLGAIFSGSAAIDRGNTSKLGKDKDPMICMYTSHGAHEQQSIAYSEDRIHFTPYEGNPVITNTTLKDFRDPKVFRNTMLDCWSVILAAGDHVEIFASPDFIHWEKTGEFGREENKLGGIFECPDLFPLPAPDGGELWVLTASMSFPNICGGPRTQYFLGTFDGRTFHQTVFSAHPLLIDSGYDNYAAVTFFGAEKPLMLGWGTSWSYANKEPTGEFCGLMTCAREMSLVNTVEGVRMANQPVTPAYTFGEAVSAADEKPQCALTGEQFCIHVEADRAFRVTLSNAQGEAFHFGMDTTLNFFTDRTEAGERDFHPQYKNGLYSVTVTPRLKEGKVDMYMYFDRCISEIFADDGTYINTALVFPKQPYAQASIEGDAKMWIGTL